MSAGQGARQRQRARQGHKRPARKRGKRGGGEGRSSPALCILTHQLLSWCWPWRESCSLLPVCQKTRSWPERRASLFVYFGIGFWGGVCFSLETGSTGHNLVKPSPLSPLFWSCRGRFTRSMTVRGRRGRGGGGRKLRDLSQPNTLFFQLVRGVERRPRSSGQRSLPPIVHSVHGRCRTQGRPRRVVEGYARRQRFVMMRKT